MNIKFGIIIFLLSLLLFLRFSTYTFYPKFVVCGRNISDVYSGSDVSMFANGCSAYGPFMLMLFIPFIFFSSELLVFIYPLFFSIVFIVSVFIALKIVKKYSLLIPFSFYCLITLFTTEYFVEILFFPFILLSLYFYERDKLLPAYILLFFLFFSKIFLIAASIILFVIMFLSKVRASVKILPMAAIIFSVMVLFFLLNFNLVNFFRATIVHSASSISLSSFALIFAFFLFLSFLCFRSRRKYLLCAVIIVLLLFSPIMLLSRFKLPYLNFLTPLFVLLFFDLKKASKLLILIFLSFLFLYSLFYLSFRIFLFYNEENVFLNQYDLLPAGRSVLSDAVYARTFLDNNAFFITDLGVYKAAVESNLLVNMSLSDYLMPYLLNNSFSIIIPADPYWDVLERAGLIERQGDRILIDMCYVSIPEVINNKISFSMLAYARKILFFDYNDCSDFKQKIDNYWSNLELAGVHSDFVSMLLNRNDMVLNSLSIG